MNSVVIFQIFRTKWITECCQMFIYQNHPAVQRWIKAAAETARAALEQAASLDLPSILAEFLINRLDITTPFNS